MDRLLKIGVERRYFSDRYFVMRTNFRAVEGRAGAKGLSAADFVPRVSFLDLGQKVAR